MLLAIPLLSVAQTQIGDVYTLHTNLVVVTGSEQDGTNSASLQATQLQDGNSVKIKNVEQTISGPWCFVAAFETLRRPGYTIYTPVGCGWIPETNLLAVATKEASETLVLPNTPAPSGGEGILATLGRAIREIRSMPTPTPQESYNTYIQQQADKAQRQLERQRIDREMQADVQKELINRMVNEH